MSYWAGFEYEVIEGYMGLVDMATEREWPDVELPPEIEDQEEDLFDNYMQNLYDLAPSAGEFLDAVKYEVETYLKEVAYSRYLDDVKEIAADYQIDEDISRLGDEFANEEIFGAIGGVPEYNEVPGYLEKFFEDVAYELCRDVDCNWAEARVEDFISYEEQQEIEQNLLLLAERAGEDEWEIIQEDVYEAFQQAKKDLEEAVQDRLEEYREEFEEEEEERPLPDLRQTKLPLD